MWYGLNIKFSNARMAKSRMLWFEKWVEVTMKTDKLLDKCFYIIGWVFIAIGVGVFAIYHAGILPSIRIAPCMIHSMTGYYCPGCGGTRATYALLHGKIITSLYYHPIVVYGVVVGGWSMISQTIERLSRGKLCIGMRYRDLYLWIALAIAIVNCLVKNLVLAITGIALLG